MPSMQLNMTPKLSFKERLHSFIFSLYSQYKYWWVFLEKQNVLMHKHFGQNLPHIKSILRNTSLILLNHHFSLSYSRPVVPNMVEVGGIQVQPSKPLPKVRLKLKK